MPEVKSPGAESSGPIPLGLVGVKFGGYIARAFLLQEPARSYFRLAALCDANPAQLQKAVEEIPGGFTGKNYHSLDELLKDPEIGVVGLFTGPARRAELIRRIIRSGRDVITTKPFELDPAAALDVLNEARSLGRTVVMNSPGPVLSPDLALMTEWREKHQLGPALAARAEATASYREPADSSWYDDPAQCPVAPIFRIGVYLINDLAPFFQEPERVHVLHSRIFTGRPTPDQGQLGIRYRNGALVNVFASFCVADGDAYRNSLTINFERGTIHRETGPQRGEGCSLSLVMADGQGKRQIVESATVGEESGSYPWKTFYDIMHGNPPGPVTSPEAIVTGIRIVQAMGEAERGNGWADVRD